MTRFVKIVLAAAALAVYCIPAALAESDDDHFVALMNQQGEQGSIDTLGAAKLIAEAHQVCADLSTNGNLMSEIAAAMGAVPGLSPHGASALVGAAHFAYCP